VGHLLARSKDHGAKFGEGKGRGVFSQGGWVEGDKTARGVIGTEPVLSVVGRGDGVVKKEKKSEFAGLRRSPHEVRRMLWRDSS